MPLGNLPCDLDLKWKVILDLVGARAGKNSHDLFRLARPVPAECGIQHALGCFVEERVADILGPQATIGIPFWLEGQSAQNMVDVATHAANSPGSPRPKLRWKVI